MRPLTGYYHYLPTSKAGFLRQLAVSYIRHGYFFYSKGYISDKHLVERADRSIITRYNLAVSKHKRRRDKQKGLGKVQYLRLNRFYLILATHKAHKFFEHETRIRDFKRNVLHFDDYLISAIKSPTHKLGYKVHVRLDDQTEKGLKATFLDLAMHRNKEELEALMQGAFDRYECYGGVKNQFRDIIEAVNNARAKQRYRPVRKKLFRDRIRTITVFGPENHGWPIYSSKSKPECSPALQRRAKAA